MLPKLIFNYRLAIFLYLFSSCFSSYSQTSVNAIIGNVGYENRHQVAVSDTSSEFELIQAHLAFTEKLFRQRNVEKLTETQKENRAKALVLLNEYWQNGQFPKNSAFPNERRPCFVDEDKTICAVGYLVEQTAGKELVQQINKWYQYDYILDMDLPALDKWIKEYGFSKTEIATIQPNYGPSRNLSSIQINKIRKIVFYNERNAGKTVNIAYRIRRNGKNKSGKGIFNQKRTSQKTCGNIV